MRHRAAEKLAGILSNTFLGGLGGALNTGTRGALLGGALGGAADLGIGALGGMHYLQEAERLGVNPHEWLGDIAHGTIAGGMPMTQLGIGAGGIGGAALGGTEGALQGLLAPHSAPVIPALAEAPTSLLPTVGAVGAGGLGALALHRLLYGDNEN